jgi:Domain of unknown function (DUF4279)
MNATPQESLVMEPTVDMHSEISTYFRLTGAFNPDEITAVVGIAPTKTHRAGDLISPRATMRYQNNVWRLDSSLDQSCDLEDHIKDVLERLQPGGAALINLCTQYAASIECVISSYGGDRPAIAFSRDLLKQVTALNAEIGVDLYVLPGKPNT